MGRISHKLAARLRGMKPDIKNLAQSSQELRNSVQGPTDVIGMQELVESGYDPVHAAYVSAQNLVSALAEDLSALDEFAPYCQIISAAQDEYVPGGPPMSPLTNSFFTTWAFFDCRFGPDGETMGTCILDVADLLPIDGGMLEIIRNFQESRMGIYVHCGMASPSTCVLRELISNRRFTGYPASGYQGQAGQLWFVRLCPPLFNLTDYHVAFTTPYILTSASEDDWAAYLKRSTLSGSGTDASDRIGSLLKYGSSTNHWNEFVLEAYDHSQADAVFLAGLPDVKGSLPHASRL